MAYVDALTFEMVTDRRDIALHYMRGWFILDFVSILPIGYITMLTGGDEDSGAGKQTKALKILRMVRLSKLLRISKLKRLVRKHSEDFDGLAAGFKLCGTMLVLFFTAHLVACTWYFVGDSNDGWVTLFPQERLSQKYLVSFWFALSVLLAPTFAPDIAPVNGGETLMVMALSVMGSVMAALIIATISSTVMSRNLLEAKVSRQLAELREFLKEQKLPPDLVQQIRKYMERFYSMKTGYDVLEIMDSLPPGLKTKLMDHMYSDMVTKIPLFRACSRSAIQMMCLALKPYHVLPGEIVCKEGENCDAMYIVESGGVILQRFGITLGLLGAKSCFGQEGLLPGINVREHTAVARQNTQLVFLTQADMKTVIKEHPEVLQQLQECGKRRAKRETNRLNRLIEDSAKSLGVDQHSDIMEDVLMAVDGMCSGKNSEVAAMEASMKAATTVQRFIRGVRGRRKAAFVRDLKRSEAARQARTRRVRAMNPSAAVGDLHLPAQHPTQQPTETGAEAGEEGATAPPPRFGVLRFASKLQQSAKRAQLTVKYQTEQAISGPDHSKEVQEVAANIVSALASARQAEEDASGQAKTQRVERGLQLPPKEVVSAVAQRIERDYADNSSSHPLVARHTADLEEIKAALATLTTIVQRLDRQTGTSNGQFRLP